MTGSVEADLSEEDLSAEDLPEDDLFEEDLSADEDLSEEDLSAEDLSEEALSEEAFRPGAPEPGAVPCVEPEDWLLVPDEEPEGLEVVPVVRGGVGVRVGAGTIYIETAASEKSIMFRSTNRAV